MKDIEKTQREIEDLFLNRNQDFPATWKWQETNGKVFYIENKTNKKRISTIKNCKNCERKFAVRNDWINSVFYCCKFCNEQDRRNRIEVSCSWCNIMFSKKISKLNGSKSGLYFCTRKCKDKAQTIEGGLKEIQPNHYKDGSKNYLARAIKHYGAKCINCNITFKPFLEVHHKDSNRENGNINNLEVLCIIHHYMRHMVYDEKSKRWKVDFSVLTSKEDLDKLLKFSIQ